MTPQEQTTWMIVATVCALALPLTVLAKPFFLAVRARLRAHAAGATAAHVIERNAKLFAHDVGRSGATLSTLLTALSGVSESGARETLVEAFARDASLSHEALTKLSGFASAVLELGGSSRPLTSDSLEPAALVEQALRRVLSTSSFPPDLNVELRSVHTRKLRGDQQRLVEALAHLLSNAVEAAGLSGRIWIECHDIERGDLPYIAICVGNSGPVIPEDQHKVIFLPFYTAGKQAAAGLGLAVVRRIAKLHRGRIEVRSVPGQGTEFMLTLPAAMTPSRYRPQCANATLRGIAAALTPAPSLGMA